jgi:hypothetical protein
VRGRPRCRGRALRISGSGGTGERRGLQLLVHLRRSPARTKARTDLVKEVAAGRELEQDKEARDEAGVLLDEDGVKELEDVAVLEHAVDLDLLLELLTRRPRRVALGRIGRGD